MEHDQEHHLHKNLKTYALVVIVVLIVLSALFTWFFYVFPGQDIEMLSSYRFYPASKFIDGKSEAVLSRHERKTKQPPLDLSAARDIFSSAASAELGN